MSMDGLSLYAALNTIRPLILGGKIDKVQQPERDALLFTLRAGGATRRLLISTHAQNGRVQLTELSYPNPDAAPAFCMLLRKRIVGGRIAAIEQAGLDRILRVEIAARDELMDETGYTLVVEIMGKYSNVMLLDRSGRILDALKHVAPDMSTVRTVLPNLMYETPPSQNKLNPFALTPQALTEALTGPETPCKLLSDRFEGLSRATINALCYEASDPQEAARRLLSLKEGPYRACLVCNGSGEPAAVYPFSPRDPSLNVEEAGTLSQAYDRYYEERDRAVRLQRAGSALRRSVENSLSRAEKKLAVYNDAIDGESRFEEFRLFGELITANLHLLRRGQASAVLQNYYLDPPAPVTVPLDILLSPSDNAQRYYKRYRKSRTARDYAMERREGLLSEIAYLEGQLDNLDKCTALGELTEIREELIRERFIKPDREKRKPLRLEPSRPMRYRSVDGISIYVGKNNRQNDDLTLRRAEGDNLFLHAKNIPGSHVIVEFLREPPEATLRQAALLAAYYSKARASASVAVDYTPRKYVKKPSGARPGMVIYSTNRTLYVTPDKAAVAAIPREE